MDKILININILRFSLMTFGLLLATGLCHGQSYYHIDIGSIKKDFSGERLSFNGTSYHGDKVSGNHNLHGSVGILKAFKESHYWGAEIGVQDHNLSIDEKDFLINNRIWRFEDVNIENYSLYLGGRYNYRLYNLFLGVSPAVNFSKTSIRGKVYNVDGLFDLTSFNEIGTSYLLFPSFDLEVAYHLQISEKTQLRIKANLSNNYYVRVFNEGLTINYRLLEYSLGLAF